MTRRRNKDLVHLDRRGFLKGLAAGIPPLLLTGALASTGREGRGDWVLGDGYRPREHRWGMGISINRCIGCGRCVDACKRENDVPPEPFFFRTWVERYIVFTDGTSMVDSPGGAIQGFTHQPHPKQTARSFFVPKLCNQCDHPPCVQVCPVGATFRVDDGVVLVDDEYCIGCRYCIQACPYGARFLHPAKHVAEKCTFCYHRLVRGLLPVCVEVCPNQARILGELTKRASPLVRFMRMNKIGVLKQSLNTEPKVYYSNLDMEVR